MKFFRFIRWIPVWILIVSSNIVGLPSGLTKRALAAEEPLTAQIMLDVTLVNESSVVTPGVEVRGLPAGLIEGGAARNRNLFHRFFDFNVDAGQRVYFANLSGILDIFSRVTGNTPSSVLGTLGVDGGCRLISHQPQWVALGS